MLVAGMTYNNDDRVAMAFARRSRLKQTQTDKQGPHWLNDSAPLIDL